MRDSLTLIYRNQSVGFSSSFSLFLPWKQGRYQIIKHFYTKFDVVWRLIAGLIYTLVILELQILEFVFLWEFSYSFLAKLSRTGNKCCFYKQILFKSVENWPERKGKRNRMFYNTTLTLSDFFVLVAAMTLTRGLSLSSQ